MLVSHEKLLDLADVYALGALDGDELVEFQTHLSAGCVECHARVKEAAAALTSLPSSITPLTPPDRVKSRLFEDGFAGLYLSIAGLSEVLPTVAQNSRSKSPSHQIASGGNG